VRTMTQRRKEQRGGKKSPGARAKVEWRDGAGAAVAALDGSGLYDCTSHSSAEEINRGVGERRWARVVSSDNCPGAGRELDRTINWRDGVSSGTCVSGGKLMGLRKASTSAGRNGAGVTSCGDLL
jgi:hypothetical protein